MKPYSAFRDLTQPLHLSSKLGTIHYECELVILIGQSIGPHHNIAVEEAIEGIGLGLDLTLRDLQSQLKKQGHPWERAKSFDGSCVVGPMIPFDKSMSLDDIHFRLLINESLKQEGHSTLMIFSITTLITQISEIFTLSPGDIIMTGTPAGVGELNDGDSLTLTLGDQYHISTQVKIDE
jgi:2-keto-4-pentenoate hydratase/2-oxohepta-3-ene-1,7-dioic acid hydratase in catechol pathway